MRLLDANARPVGIHFFGNDQRQAGADAGSHLGAVCDDRDNTVRCDRDEHARIHDGTVRHLVGTGLVRGKCRARHDGCRQDEAAGQPEALQDAAARNVFDFDVLLKATELPGIGANVHDQTPVEARWTAFSMRW